MTFLEIKQGEQFYEDVFMRFVSLGVASILGALFFVVTSASGATISGSTQIVASTDIDECGAICQRSNWPISEIVDEITTDGVFGNVATYNGFAGKRGQIGKITLNLVGVFNLQSFTLFNDIIVNAEGVGTFELSFFDSADAFISKTGILTAPAGQEDGETYTFANTIMGVSRVDMDILSLLNNTGVEIREVYFNGTEVSAVPLPAGLPLLLVGFGTIAALKRRRG